MPKFELFIMAYPKNKALFLLFIFIFFHSFLVSTPFIYNAVDDIVLDCGSSGNSSLNGDPRTWMGDISSKFFPSQFLQNSNSVSARAQTQSSSVADVPYITARLSRSEFTYSFPLTPGQKFIRLYFYPAFYPNFDRSKAVFSARVGPYTLLRDFNASVNADASSSEIILREFCMFVEGNDDKLNITFIPSNQDSYAFVSGIEIVSMPINLYYTPPPQPSNQLGRGLKFVGQDNRFFPVENFTSLEMVYRINIGGNTISPAQDTGMFRSWLKEDMSYLSGLKQDARPLNLTIPFNFTKKPQYTAPEDVYRTARTMGPNTTINKSYNITWNYPVDPRFLYMLRLHFCEFESNIGDPGDRVFLIYIRDLIAEESADVIQWAGGKGIPYYRDYIVSVSGGSSNDKKVDLSVKLQPNPDDSKTRWSNVILNGIEIFKLNDTNGNLAGQNPDPPPNNTPSLVPPSILEPHNSKGNKLAIVISSIVGGLVFCIVAVLVLRWFIFRRGNQYKDQLSNEETTWWSPFSVSTTKSSKTRNTALPSNLCRYFTLSEIKAATKDFDDVFIIGVGGFGDVYKGYIDDGTTQVAIKRLKAGSKQGAHEFQTEIEMLSQLRHLHLVSLIGYCNDGNEMILVYDYMSKGTLRNHLYGSDEPPIPWKQRLQICIGAAKGLHYLHTGAKHTIIHRDVKTTNILIDEKWVAKVSDFGLSKVGPTNMSKAHVSTVVKGSFGYLDPEYYRRQQLTEKSDVYSFGVVLSEILCARPPLIRTTDKKQISLADWVQSCHRDKTLNQIIDPSIKDEISKECLEKFIEIAVSCIQDEGIQRPSMNDVVWSLEFASQLQETSKKDDVDFAGAGDEKLMKKNGEDRYDVVFSSNDGKQMSEFTSSEVTTTSGDGSSFSNAKEMSGTVIFSEIFDPKGR